MDYENVVATVPIRIRDANLFGIRNVVSKLPPLSPNPTSPHVARRIVRQSRPRRPAKFLARHASLALVKKEY